MGLFYSCDGTWFIFQNLLADDRGTLGNINTTELCPGGIHQHGEKTMGSMCYSSPEEMLHMRLHVPLPVVNHIFCLSSTTLNNILDPDQRQGRDRGHEPNLHLLSPSFSPTTFFLEKKSIS